jgi:hypothetical protein
LAALFASFSALHSLFKAQAMNAMNCESRPPAEFAARIAEESARVPYTAKDAESSFPVTFHFNLDEAVLSDTVMTIESTVTRLKAGNALLYRGPYKETLVLRIDKELFDEGREGLDNFGFAFFNRQNREICVQEQDSGALYWKPNANVYIDFLDRRELDKEIGTPVGHKVRIY